MKLVQKRIGAPLKALENNMAKKNNSDAVVQNSLREKIVAETEAFLASGKKIQEIPTGLSGQNAQNGSRHIRISTKKD
ncbi:MAG: hypothetical protein O2949_08945 [Proteobacteria bacterium]|jgi:hypothetical protein|nr:hypothetical protein [Pseudomonadota bacterium]